MANQARAHVELTAGHAKFDAALRRSHGNMSQWRASMTREIGRAKKARVNAEKMGGKQSNNFIGGAIAVKGLEVMMDTANEVRSFERNLQRLALAGNLSSAELGKLRTQIRSVSRETGVADSEILQGAQTYVDLTGDVKGASVAMGTFARIAQASGASVSDVAQAASALQQANGLDASQIEATFSGLIVQGKAGAVSLKDFAGELATLAPMMAQFEGGKSVEGIRGMGAAFQVVRRASGSASEASTKLQSLIGSIIKNAPKLETVLGKGSVLKRGAGGVKSLRDFEGIIKSISNSKLMSDPTLLGKKLGNDKESLQAINALSREIALYDQLKSAAQDTGAVQRDMNAYLQSDAGKIDTAFNNFKLTLAEVFTPERIAAFANALGFVVDKLAKIVGFLDRVGKTVDAVVNAPKNDAIEAGKVAGQRKIVNEYARTKDKSAAAQYAMTEAARLQREMEEGGYSGDKRFKTEGEIAALREQAMKFREEGDVWGATQSGQAAFDAKNGKNAVAAGKLTQEQANTIVTSDFIFELKRGLKDAFGELRVEVGADKVVNATRKSAANNTRPPH